MSTTSVSFRVDTGLVRSYQALAKRLKVPLAQLLRESLFLSLLRIDASATGKVQFTER